MKKTLLYIYGFMALFVVPIIIGSGVANDLVRFYETYSRHWIAGIVVCCLTGAVSTWFPMLFWIGGFPFSDSNKIKYAAIFGWAGGIIAPPIFGFRNLGMILAFLIILTTFYTLASLFTTHTENSRRIDGLRRAIESKQVDPPDS